ncbi:DUF4159 domain-containing protein [Colwellia sp. MB3u-70]|uniref:DUF4159 domain-containing protein n=1 Tax=unclassified Colwellia TaxID=196834 RepID=UPI0015F6D7CB|nr:DUF4159 domain-containing protein [Colwellia sp. MB3u-8]MBA6307157.1 DUF4159 domain-containing protein [Colwellia sp. MB3u-70]
MNRRNFIRTLSLLSVGALSTPFLRLSAQEQIDFFFTRLSYESGDWEVDERMPANVLNSLIEYTSLRVDIKERIIALSSPQMLAAPFCYLAGHRLVQFNVEEKQNFQRYVENGGFVFVDDCNHDIDGMFARSFERQMRDIFGEQALNKIPNDHPIYSSFFNFEGPPRTSVELNGWGDDLVHNYLKAIEIDGRIAVLYSNKDLGCEWDYDFRNKRWLKVDNTRFAVNIVMYAMNS